MKSFFIKIFIILFFFIIIIIGILSTKGIETERFNEFITEKIIKKHNYITLSLKKIRFRFSFKDFNLFLETKNPELTYRNIEIPIKNIEIYLDFASLVNTNPKIDKISIDSKQINIDQLKNIVIKTKPSNLNSLILNRIKKGKLIANLEIYFKENLKVDNFIAKGEVTKLNGAINKNLILQKTSFNFFADNSDLLIKNVKSQMNGFLIKDGNIKVERDKNINIKSEFFSEVDLNKKNIQNYLPYLMNNNFINKQTHIKGTLNHNLNLIFDSTFKVTNYSYKSRGKIKKSNLKLSKSINNIFLENDINVLSLKDSDIEVRYGSDKKNYISSSGNYSLDNQNFKSYKIKNNFLEDSFKIELDLELAEKLNIDLINYKKNKNIDAMISVKFEKKKKLINFKEINYKENKNFINIKKMIINKNQFISLNSIVVKTFNDEKLNNDFKLIMLKEIKIDGKKFDATNLNKILTSGSKKSIFKRINKNIIIDFENITTPLSKKLKNFRLIGSVKKGKFVKISSKGDFGNNKFLDISLKSDNKSEKKFLEVYSDLPQPLLSEYSFFKGLTEGKLIFSSIIEGDSTNSKLVLENFKIVNAPGVVKLLSLADFGGLADLAEGEGLSFEKLEIKMNKNKNLLKLEEFYAVGPSISVLMDGYTDSSGLTSLRGTLVPAKNLNKVLSKIPVIGKIIIPQEIGEGLFGVSFKMKGMPGKIKTSINPIKTLTPRFITKALEKTKKN